MSAEPITSLDEKYISNSIIYNALTASASLFLDGDSLRNNSGDLDHEAIRARIDAASWSAPALRKRLRRAPLALSAAAWVPVEQLDLDYHVRFHQGVVADGPGAAAILAGRTEGALARNRPPWRILFVELASGDVALVFTWQHVMGDATYGVTVLRLLLDPHPSPPIRVVTASQRLELGRAPRTGVGMLSHIGGEWWASHPSAKDRWTAYRSRPFGRRLRRWGARMVRPARDGIIRWRRLGDRMPARAFRMMHFDLAESQDLARRLGGSLNDLTVAAALKGIFDTRPELEEAALLVPISGRNTDTARNTVSAVLVTVPSGLPFDKLIETVRAQVRRGAISGNTNSPTGARLGYATMVPTGEVDRYLGETRVRSIAGWPAGDPRDDIAVLATSYDDTITVAVSTFDTTDIDAFVASVSASFVGTGVAA